MKTIASIYITTFFLMLSAPVLAAINLPNTALSNKSEDLRPSRSNIEVNKEQVHVVSNYINGLKEGLEKHLFSSGKTSIEMFYINSIQEGDETHYYENGSKKAVISYKGGKKEGLMTSWYPSGKMLGIATFKNNHHSGVSSAWFENGNLKAKGEFEHGLQNGVEIRYYGNGQKKQWQLFGMVRCMAKRLNGIKVALRNLNSTMRMEL